MAAKPKKRAHAPKPPKEKTKRPVGRPTMFSAELGKRICKDLIELKTLLRVCRQEGMPEPMTVYRWLVDGQNDINTKAGGDKANFVREYTQAREWAADGLFDECADIADDGRNDWMTKETQTGSYVVLNHEHVSRSTLRVKTRMDMVARISPKKYAPTNKLADAEGNTIKLPPALQVTVQGGKDERPSGDSPAPQAG